MRLINLYSINKQIKDLKSKMNVSEDEEEKYEIEGNDFYLFI